MYVIVSLVAVAASGVGVAASPASLGLPAAATESNFVAMHDGGSAVRVKKYGG